jgi:para-nitrobenzyl esterase
MPRVSVLVCVALALGCAGKPAPTPAPTADATSLRNPPAGPVVGFVGAYGAHAWLGIPFAKPPVGEMRWRAPEPMPAWHEARQALAFGSRCPQFSTNLSDVDVEAGTPIGAEDCLTLDVYAPAFEADAVPTGAERRPVMVWIHGGGNTIGHSSEYDGGQLAQDQDVVVVMLNYRLGPFGWFHHPALAQDADERERGGNFGTLDLIRGLEWVRENIAAFGGDPHNVTVFGESAGGRNVVQLLLSPPARGLFQRAIVQSGGLRSSTLAEGANYVDDPEPGHASSSREAALRMLAAGEERSAARAKLDALGTDELAQRLRALSAREVLSGYDGSRLGMIDLPQVFRDGVVLPSEPLPTVFGQANAVAAVPILLGTNKDEQKTFLFFDPKYVRRWFGIVPQILDTERYMLTAEYQSKSWKAIGADEPAMALASLGRDDVFVYRFDWDEEPKLLWVDLGQVLGAAHAFEVPFVFGHWQLGAQSGRLFDESNRQGREQLSRAMMSYWGEFARSGAPGKGKRGELPLWTAWNENGDKFIVLDTEAGGGPRMTREGVVTNRALVAEMRSDPRLADTALRCKVLGDVITWSPALDESDYAAGGCDGNPVVASE